MIKKHVLYLGLNDKDSKVQEIATLDAYKIAMNLIAGVGYEGASISESTGFYTHENGEFVIEKSFRIEILFADEEKTANLIRDLKKAFNQESIAFQSEMIESKLV